MRTFCKIIVEQSNGLWSAYFPDHPRVITSSSQPATAIRQLLDHFGEEQFDIDGVIYLDDDARLDHREFLIPLMNLQRVPNTPEIKKQPFRPSESVSMASRRSRLQTIIG